MYPRSRIEDVGSHPRRLRSNPQAILACTTTSCPRDRRSICHADKRRQSWQRNEDLPGGTSVVMRERQRDIVVTQRDNDERMLNLKLGDT